MARTDNDKQDDAKKPVSRLFLWLEHEIRRQDKTVSDLLEILDFSRTHYYSLRANRRPIEGLGEEKLEEIAAFLNVNVGAVLLAAGSVQPSYFSRIPRRDLINELKRALTFIEMDPEWGVLLPPDVHELPVNMQIFIVKAYEKAEKKVLMSRVMDVDDIMALIDGYVSD